MQEADDLVQAGEVDDTVRTLQFGPAEDVDRDEPDADLAHERDVFAPDGRIPLLGVVVAPEVDPSVLVARPGDALLGRGQ